MGMDDQVMPHIHMANIACGFHASDPLVMEHTLKLAKQMDVVVGAHPGYPDLVGFGRRSMQCTSDEIRTLLLYQISALSGMARVVGTQVSYVKPHGALYNDMMRDPALAETIISTLALLPDPLKLVLQATTRNDDYREIASKYGVGLCFEAFADRAYDAKGLLLSRQEPGAVFIDENQILARVERLVTTGEIVSVEGDVLRLEPDTLCVHGDNQHAVALAAAIRKRIDDH
jgi:UPF0271 protein